MDLLHPYVHGGWFTCDSDDDTFRYSQCRMPQPSIYGALPFALLPSPKHMHRFGFKYEETILKSLVFGPQNRAYFRVANDCPREGLTLFTNVAGDDFSTIDWQGSEVKRAPQVEIKDLVKKQAVSSWLPLTRCHTQRIMDARGRRFYWIPNNDSISLYFSSHTMPLPTIFAKVSLCSKLKTVILEATTEAIQIGILEHCVVATVLFQSGINID